MKKIPLLLFLVIAINNSCSAQVFSWQESLVQVAKNYFRSDPFIGEFSKFLDHLINDPTLVSKTINKRTDTTYFYLSGDYTTHNPFFFKARRTQVILAESEITINDTVRRSATMMIYQLVGYTEAGKEGAADVKNEFEKFDRKYLKRTRSNNYSEIKNGNEVNGATRNYFILPGGFIPLSAAWQKIGPDKGNVFVITLRFMVSDNEAALPASEDSP